MAKQVLTEAVQQGAFARMIGGIQQRQQKLDDLIFRAEKSESRLIEQHRRRWERASAAVRHYDARRMLAGIRKDLATQTAAVATAVRTILLRQKSQIDQLQHQLKALSPVAILERGYALVFDSSGKLVKSSAQVGPGDEISARLAHGAFTARVEKKR
jgi:exodeoxyribonuclease VII large subunit